MQRCRLPSRWRGGLDRGAGAGSGLHRHVRPLHAAPRRGSSGNGNCARSTAFLVVGDTGHRMEPGPAGAALPCPACCVCAYALGPQLAPSVLRKRLPRRLPLRFAKTSRTRANSAAPYGSSKAKLINSRPGFDFAARRLAEIVSGGKCLRRPRLEGPQLEGPQLEGPQFGRAAVWKDRNRRFSRRVGPIPESSPRCKRIHADPQHPWRVSGACGSGRFCRKTVFCRTVFRRQVGEAALPRYIRHWRMLKASGEIREKRGFRSRQ